MCIEIRSAILEGDIDRALTATEDHFPEVLENNPEILFHLKCRKWLELFNKAVDLKAQQEPKQKQRSASNGFAKDSAVEDDFAQDMELDEQPNGSSQPTATIEGQADQYEALLKEAMEYGQVLNKDYRDDQDDWQKTLRDIFSLVAYDDPRGSIHGALLDRKGRVVVAEELNSAILGKSCYFLPSQRL